MRSRAGHELEVEAPLVVAEGTPAVATREGLGHLGRPFADQGARDRCRGRQRQAQRLPIEQHRALALDQRGVEVGAGKGSGAQHAAQELHIGRDADDLRLCQRLVEPCQRLFARRTVHDQLGDHRIVEGRDHTALAHAVVDAHRPRVRRRRPAACDRCAACRWPAGSCCRGSRRRCGPRSHGRGCAVAPAPAAAARPRPRAVAIRPGRAR